MSKKHFLIMSLALPVIILISIAIKKHINIYTGKKVIIPIVGFDPRDILSGHYLIYKLNYGKNPYCKKNTNYESYNAFMCLKEENNSLNSVMYYDYYDLQENSCDLFIYGECRNGHFIAGIEKFFIPEDQARLLDNAVRDKKGKLIISVTSGGKASIKNLLIDDMDWQDWVTR